MEQLRVEPAGIGGSALTMKPEWYEQYRGAEMDRHYLEGDYLHVVEIAHGTYTPGVGDHVIARIERSHAHSLRTCRQIAMENGELVLRGDSNSEGLNAPIPLHGGEGITVEVCGLVVGRYRPFFGLTAPDNRHQQSAKAVRQRTR